MQQFMVYMYSESNYATQAKLTKSLSAGEESSGQNERPLRPSTALDQSLSGRLVHVSTVYVVNIPVFPITVVQRVFVHRDFWSIKYRWLATEKQDLVKVLA